MDAEKKTPTTTTTSEKPKDNDLPTNSPYVDDSGSLEDYKMKAYGAKGHQEVKAGLGGGATDAPTPSGDAPASTTTTTAAAKAP